MKDRLELNTEAIGLRRSLGEDTFCPIDIFAIVGKLEHFTMVFYPFSDRISGMCEKIGDEKLVAVNSRLTYGRQRFSAAHELYHLFVQEDMQSKMICERNIDGDKPEVEKEANMFASFFLAPYEAMQNYLKEVLKKRPLELACEDIIKTEQFFQMSRQATLNRLKNEGWITKEFADTMETNIRISALRLGYSAALYTPTPEERQYMTTGSYVKLAGELKEKEIVSEGKYNELLLNAFRSDIVYNMDISEVEHYD